MPRSKPHEWGDLRATRLQCSELGWGSWLRRWWLRKNSGMVRLGVGARRGLPEPGTPRPRLQSPGERELRAGEPACPSGRGGVECLLLLSPTAPPVGGGWGPSSFPTPVLACEIHAPCCASATGRGVHQRAALGALSSRRTEPPVSDDLLEALAQQGSGPSREDSGETGWWLPEASSGRAAGKRPLLAAREKFRERKAHEDNRTSGKEDQQQEGTPTLRIRIVAQANGRKWSRARSRSSVVEGVQGKGKVGEPIERARKRQARPQ